MATAISPRPGRRRSGGSRATATPETGCFTDPEARDDDGVAQANRSSTRDQLRELTTFIDSVKAQTGAQKVAIVALSRGGYSTRGYVAANPGSVKRAVLGGTPNHGVFAIVEDRPIIGAFNEERIVARAWPAKDDHMTIMELTG